MRITIIYLNRHLNLILDIYKNTESKEDLSFNPFRIMHIPSFQFRKFLIGHRAQVESLSSETSTLVHRSSRGWVSSYGDFNRSSNTIPQLSIHSLSLSLSSTDYILFTFLSFFLSSFSTHLPPQMKYSFTNFTFFWIINNNDSQI